MHTLICQALTVVEEGNSQVRGPELDVAVFLRQPQRSTEVLRRLFGKVFGIHDVEIGASTTVKKLRAIKE